MSYIKYKEKVFYETRNPAIGANVSCGKLKFVSSDTDPRAWSINNEDKRSYLLDIVINTPSSRPGSRRSSASSRSKSPYRELRKRSKTKKKMLKRKYKSLDDLVLFYKDKFKKPKQKDPEMISNTVEQLENENENLKKKREETESEIDNLRKFVKDLQEEISTLKNIRLENVELRSQINSDIKNKLIEAQEEINYLASQLDIYKEFQTKYENMKSSNQIVRQDHHALNQTLIEIKMENENLKDEIYHLKRTVDTHESRDLVASNAIIDKHVLRERIQMREEKINFLLSFVEDQELTIHDLSLQLEKLTSGISRKETAMGKYVEVLKETLDEKVSKVSVLENRLQETECLVRELENLRNEFRLSNCTLFENVQNYRRQFNIVVACSYKLADEIDQYRKELEEKDNQIKKLSIFPQTATTMVYFAHLLKLLRTIEENMKRDSNVSFDYIQSMRKLVEQIKDEVFGSSEMLPGSFLICDINTQTEIRMTNSETQFEFISWNKAVEAHLPDEYYYRNEELLKDINVLNENMTSLQEAYFGKDESNRHLQRQLISSIEDRKTKEKENDELKKEINLLKEKLMTLKSELEYNDGLLDKAISEIECDKSVRESASALFNETLDATLYEYNRYVSVLETTIAFKDDNLDSLNKYITNETGQEHMNEYVSKLEHEIKRITDYYSNEQLTTKELNGQVKSLKQALAEKVEHIRLIQEKLFRAEKIFEHLNNIEKPREENGQTVFVLESHSTQPDRINSPDKILSNNEPLEIITNEEKNKNETLPKNVLLRLLNKNRHQKNKLKNIIKKVQNKLKKLKESYCNVRKKLKDSEYLKIHYENFTNELQMKYSVVEGENRSFINEIENCKTQIEELEYTLVVQDDRVNKELEERLKMEKMLNKILRKLEKYKAIMIKEKDNKGTATDEDPQVNNEEVNTLRAEVEELTQKNTDLSDFIVKLQEKVSNLLYIPEKDTSSSEKEHFSSFGVQVNCDDRVQELEAMVDVLQRDKARETDKAERQHFSNLRMLKETYERDVKNMKRAHEESILKLQALHEEEVTCLKQVKEENSKHMVSLSEVEDKHQEELKKLKQYYEDLIKSKEQELNIEVQELKSDVDKLLNQKDEEVKKLNDRIADGLQKLKVKYKRYLRMLTKKHRDEIDNVHNKHSNELEQFFNRNEKNRQEEESQTEMFSVNSNGTQTEEDRMDLQQIKQMALDIQDPEPLAVGQLLFEPDKINIEEGFKCSIKETQGNKTISFKKEQYSRKMIMPSLHGCGDYLINNFDLDMIRDREFLINRISELENELFQKSQDNNTLATAYEQLIRQQTTKVKEIAVLLDDEMKHSLHVQCRLGTEFHRAEKLQAEKESLSNQIVNLQNAMRNLQDAMNMEKEKYHSLKSEYDKITSQRKTTDQLEQSLERLKGKLEKAVECEKRLSEELEEDKKNNERIKEIIESNKADDNSDISKDSSYTGRSDLKVVFIQQCGILHTWSRQLLD